MRIDNIFQLGIKELRSLARDPIMQVLIVFAFSISVYSGATAMPKTLNKATIAIVDEDNSPLSLRIIDSFYLPHFIPPAVIAREEMDAGMDTGVNTFALDIPPNFQRDLLAGQQPTIQLNVDATRMTQAFTGSGYIQSMITGEVLEFAQHHRAVQVLPVELDLRARFNPSLIHAWFGAVMEVINNVTMLSIVLTGAALIREREHGTVEHLLVMPVTPFEIMTSKIWAMGLVVLVACGLSLVFVVQGILSVPIQGSLLLFLLGAALHLFATTSMGIFMGTIARSMPQFGLLMILLLLPLQMLSGGVTPRESMPDFIQMIMQLAPTTHCVSLAQAILYRGAGLEVVWSQFIYLIGIGAAFFCITLMRFRKTIGIMV